MADKFICEYLDQLTGYCSVINKGILENDEPHCSHCNFNSGCNHCSIKADIRCLIGKRCDRDDSM